jgi:hypothetical protein
VFAPFADEELQALEEKFSRIHVFTPEARPLSRWAKSGATPEPDYSLVFAACTPNEWESLTRQLNDDRMKSSAPRNLALMSIVGVSVDGKKTTADTSPDQKDRRAARRGPVEALKELLTRPGHVGIGEAVADALAKLNGLASAESEKD